MQRRNGRGGRSAEEDLVAAVRCLYTSGRLDDGLIAEADESGAEGCQIAKPRRL